MTSINAVEPLDVNRDNVIRVEWSISKRCNFTCSYCTEFVRDSVSTFPDLDVMKRTIDRVLEITDKDVHLTLTGGEPALCKHLIEFCQYAKSKKQITDISITTNGSRSTSYYKKLISTIDSITFSYHMEYAKRDRVPKTIKELSKTEHAKRINVHMMMLPTAFDEAKELIHEMRELGITVHVRRIRPAFDKFDLEKGITRWTRPYENTIPTFIFREDGKVDWTKDAGYYSDKEEEFLKTIPVSTKTDTILYREDTVEIVNKNELLMKKENFFENWLCWSGVTSLKIQPAGEVYNAACRVKNLGNIYTGFNLDTTPVVCTKQACICAADLPITKIRNEAYINLVRLDK